MYILYLKCRGKLHDNVDWMETKANLNTKENHKDRKYDKLLKITTCFVSE